MRDELETMLEKFVNRISNPYALTLALALGTAVFYVIANVYISAYLLETSMHIEDYPLSFYLKVGYIILYRLVEIAICSLAIISFYEIRENFRNKAARTVWDCKSYHLIFLIYLIIIFYLLLSPLVSNSLLYIILLSFTLMAIFWLYIGSHQRITGYVAKFKNSAGCSSLGIFIICALFVSIIWAFLLFAPQIWGHNAAVSEMKGEPNIYLKLIDNRSNLSNIHLVLRSYQNGRYVVTRNGSSRSPVYIISDNQVIKATLVPNETQPKEDWIRRLLYTKDY